MSAMPTLDQRDETHRARTEPKAPASIPVRQHPEWSPLARIVIEAVQPEIDGGRFALKRVVGDSVEVTADIYRDGHDKLRAVILYRAQDESGWSEAPMRFWDNDRWRGRFPLDHNARYLFTIEAWTDHFESWRDEVGKKHAAQQDLSLELLEGAALLAGAMPRATGRERDRISEILEELKIGDAESRVALLLSEEVAVLMAAHPDRADACRYRRELEVYADRLKAQFGSWYEMFPRSQGTMPGKSATFDDCARRLPEIQALGFDVVYFVPIHPIGRTHRKGPDNTLNAGPNDPGSPYAIGGAEGGHDAVHPDLGTLDDFRRFVQTAHEHGMEVALDFAIQCSPDHPWLKQHPNWFVRRPDGSMKYAENPPKKYQDIVNIDFYSVEREAVWSELRDVVLFWVDQGVKIFRVDNPHTKPVPFWEWMIREVQDTHPDVLFLAEAFTRPKMMRMLGKVGFSQSYTYFTWRNTKRELIEYLEELSFTGLRDVYRPNFFVNTPDILPIFLQTSGRPGFRLRLALAATLSPTYGIYNGYELCEAAAIEGREEYLHSEKYDYKVWDWDRPGHIKDDIAKLNRLRRDQAALQSLDTLKIGTAYHDEVLFYGKVSDDRSSMVLVVINLNPHETREVTLDFPVNEMGVGYDRPFRLTELYTGSQLTWTGMSHWVRLDPNVNPAIIWTVVPA